MLVLVSGAIVLASHGGTAVDDDTSAADVALSALVVEDEALVRMMVCDILQDAGFAVAEAGNAAEALGALVAASDCHPSVLVTDIGMGKGLDGLVLAAAARRVRPGLPVVYVMANPERLAGRRFGPDERLLAKPFDPDALVREIVNLAGAAARVPTPAAR
jgi:two-component system OmpR family response regulator